MNREDIIRMARDAGFIDADQDSVWITDGFWTQELKRFAALVAAAEREVIAQMIENAPTLVSDVQNDRGGCLICGFTPAVAAKAIRARSNP